MAISYPIAWPTTVGPRETRYNPEQAAAVTESPYTFAQEVQENQGARWAVDVVYPPLGEADARELLGALLSLKGRVGTLLWSDPFYAAARGSWAGTPVLDGNHAARATTLALTGATPSAANVARAGDFLQFGSGATTELHAVLADASADGSGDLSIDIWPPLRNAVSTATAPDTTAPQGLWRLAGNVMGWSVSALAHTGVTLSLVEAIEV